VTNSETDTKQTQIRVGQVILWHNLEVIVTGRHHLHDDIWCVHHSDTGQSFSLMGEYLAPHPVIGWSREHLPPLDVTTDPAEATRDRLPSLLPGSPVPAHWCATHGQAVSDSDLDDDWAGRWCPGADDDLPSRLPCRLLPLAVAASAPLEARRG
jgi:hypothetical protein